jgi:hypothetical protein
MNFVDPDTGTHTQNIESYWTKTKYKFKVMKGVSADALPSYLDERMWRDSWGGTTEEAFTNICSQISEQYIFINSPFTSVQILRLLQILQSVLDTCADLVSSLPSLDGLSSHNLVL